MSKLLNLLTILAVLYFIFWVVRRRFRHRKMAAQGYEIPKQQGIRPITLLSLLMVIMYGAYMLYFFWPF